MLELEFLKRVDWKIVPKSFVLEEYYRSMISQDPRYVQDSDVDISEVDTQEASTTQDSSEDEEVTNDECTDIIMSE